MKSNAWLLNMKPHLNSEGFKNVALAHWAGSVLQQPRLYARFMEEMTANTHTNTLYTHIRTEKTGKNVWKHLWLTEMEWSERWNEVKDRDTYLHVSTDSTSPGLYKSIQTAQVSASGPVSCETQKSSKHHSHWWFIKFFVYLHLINYPIYSKPLCTIICVKM